MNCKTCHHGMPEDPCALVQAFRHHDGMVTIYIFNPAGQLRIAEHGTEQQMEDEAHNYADHANCNLHWHWADAFGSFTEPALQKEGSCE